MSMLSLLTSYPHHPSPLPGASLEKSWNTFWTGALELNRSPLRGQGKANAFQT